MTPLRCYKLLGKICVAGSDQFVRVYDKRNMTATVYEMCPADLISSPISEIACAVYNKSGREVLALYSHDDIYLFNNIEYKTGDYLRRYQGHCNHKTKKGVHFFGPNSDYVICGSDCGTIFFWDKNTGEIVNLIRVSRGVVRCLEPHPLFPVLATSGSDDKMKVWTPCSTTYSLHIPKLARFVAQNKRCSMVGKEINRLLHTSRAILTWY